MSPDTMPSDIDDLTSSETFHPSHRQFWKNEVFKTGPPLQFLIPSIFPKLVSVGHFADHPLEDLIERIACQFTARHIRGRPRAPHWYPGWPLYMCDSRYNDRERVFVKIKNWNSCIPEEVRKSEEFMPIYLFERTVFPGKFPSPFLGPKALRGPGGIDENVGKEQEGEKEKEKEGGSPKKRLIKREANSKTPIAGGTSMPHQYASSSYLQHHPIAQSRAQADPVDRSVITAAGGLNNVHVEKLTPEIGSSVFGQNDCGCH